jgi:hypothetical protein
MRIFQETAFPALKTGELCCPETLVPVLRTVRCHTTAVGTAGCFILRGAAVRIVLRTVRCHTTAVGTAGCFILRGAAVKIALVCPDVL